MAASSCQSCPDGASFRPTGDLPHLGRPASSHGGQQANLEAFTEMEWVRVNQEFESYPF